MPEELLLLMEKVEKEAKEVLASSDPSYVVHSRNHCIWTLMDH
jgi:hypothetical protein